MIKPERLTVKAAEALQQAGALARSRGNPVINDAHLFAALLAQDDGIVVPLLQKAGLNVAQLKAETDRELARFPKQSGGGTAAAPTSWRRSRGYGARTASPTRSRSRSIRRSSASPATSPSRHASGSSTR